MTPEDLHNTTPQFQGEILVASRIIDYLSSGLYQSPSSCLKELINNAYDADATEVELYVKPDANRIIIKDNGCGLNRYEFESHFRRISESHKRDDGEITDAGRHKVGKIGIGFIAANELCDTMEIYSTKKGSSELLHVTINFAEMRQPPEQRRRDNDDISKGDYHGELQESDLESHFTYIVLEKIRGPAREILAGKTDPTPHETLYGLTPDSIRDRLLQSPLNTWQDLDPYSRAMLEIGLNVPVPYHDQWLPEHLQDQVSDLVEENSSLNFNVYYDGSELRKPIVFSGNEDSFIHRFEHHGENVSAQGYFYVQHGTIKPRELQGSLIRIRNAAVGEFDHSFLDFSQSEFPLIQRWVSCEIYADDRLEEAMNIDRRTLRVTHPSFVELQNALHGELRNVLSRARKAIYQEGNTRRRKEKAKTELDRLNRTLAQDKDQPPRDSVSPAVLAQWTANVAQKEDLPDRALLKKYSVSDLYSLIIESASETLTPPQRDRFLMSLTKKLKERS